MRGLVTADIASLTMDGVVAICGTLINWCFRESKQTLRLMSGTEKDHDTGKNGKSGRFGRATRPQSLDSTQARRASPCLI